jgi:periplasmic protein TonB
MFSSLESSWDRSARRGWTTLASFAMQALGLSLLITISIMWVGGPPRVRWLQISAPSKFAPHDVETQTATHVRHVNTAANPRPEQIVTPPVIPRTILPGDDPHPVPSAPDVTNIGPDSGRWSSTGITNGLGDNIAIVRPPLPVAAKPLIVSTLAEANILHKVQPIYPPIARQAGVHGAVELRAIISKSGTIENLVVVSGHPMLVKSAIEAVRQWRYRPYLLNNEPVEVETNITVNFLLSGG